MLVQEKISPQQLLFLLIPFIIATEILSGSTYATQFAEQDAWISMMLSSVIAIWAVLVITALGISYPGMTIMEYSVEILGRWLGKLAGVYYAYCAFLFMTFVSNQFQGIITMFTNPRTPQIVTISLFVSLCGIAAYLGIEVISRASEHITPLIIVILIGTMLLLIPNMKAEVLRPVLGHGLIPIVKGSLMQLTWLGELIYMGFLLPYTTDLKKARTSMLIAVGVIVAIMTSLTLATVMVEGPLTGKFTVPYYSAVRYIDIGGFLDRIDPAILAAWIFGGFVKEALFLWIFAVCISQLFGLQQYRVIVVPVTMLIIVGTLWAYPNIAVLIRNAHYNGQMIALVLVLLITLLLLVDRLKKRIRRML